jgi:hypothetical protein
MKKSGLNIDIWLKYGFCCKYLNEIADAVCAFSKVLYIDESSTVAAIALTELLLKQKRFDEALEVTQKSRRKSAYHRIFGVSDFLPVSKLLATTNQKYSANRYVP